jgi:hypothetical protein
MTTSASSRSIDENHPRNSRDLRKAEVTDSVRDATTRFLTDHTIPPPDLCGAVISELRFQIFDSLRREDYTSAKKMEAATHFLADTYQEHVLDGRRSDEDEVIRGRLSQARQNLCAKCAEWEEIFRLFQADETRQRSELLARQKEEELKLAENWSNPAYLISFTKPSPELNWLRKQQKLFALSKDFDTAAFLKSDVDRLRKIETVSAEERAELSMRLAREALLAQHQRELVCFTEHQRQIEAYLIRERRQAIEPMERLVAQLEIARDRYKPLNMNPRTRPKSAGVPRVMRVERPTPRMNPREVSEFRFADAPEPLPVGGVDVAKIVPALRHQRVRRGS